MVSVPPVLVAEIVYVAVDETIVGVPEITPVVVLISKPVGSAGETDQDTTVPPVTVGAAGGIAEFIV